jgi:DNA-binding XRE family transcriptional regulator
MNIGRHVTTPSTKLKRNQVSPLCPHVGHTVFFCEVPLKNFLFTKERMKNLLKIKRWEAGMRQYELASLLRCSASYLSMVENGRLKPTEEFKTRAAAALQVEVKVLFPKNYESTEILLGI